jgi:predicted methyltransferase
MVLEGFLPGTGMPEPGWREARWPEPARVLGQVGLAPGMTVIDLCSGDGWFTLHVARVGRAVFAIGIDGQLLGTARVRLAESGVANCRFIEGGACDVARLVPEPVADVFLANAFHGVPDTPRLARAVHAGLKAGGLFAIVNWHARPREETTVLGQPKGPATESRMTPKATEQAVAPAGFAPAALTDVSSYHYGAVFQRRP